MQPIRQRLGSLRCPELGSPSVLCMSGTPSPLPGTDFRRQEQRHYLTAYVHVLNRNALSPLKVDGVRGRRRDGSLVKASRTCTKVLKTDGMPGRRQSPPDLNHQNYGGVRIGPTAERFSTSTLVNSRRRHSLAQVPNRVGARGRRTGSPCPLQPWPTPGSV